MLSAEQNDRLTRVGPDTAMGKLMRRYWHPVGARTELLDHPTKAVRIFGEDLVLYVDREGRPGLIDRYCPHRRTDLAECSLPEREGLRCAYHGWMFDAKGSCIAQPFEETANPGANFKARVKTRAYPVQELCGIYFAYLGPEPRPIVPKWGPLTRENVVREITMAVLPCNWFQFLENLVDPVHVEWLHRYFALYVLAERNGTRDVGPAFRNARRHLKIAFDPLAHGIVKRRLLEGLPETGEDWTVGHPVVFPNMMLVGNRFNENLQWVVPMDYTTTLHFTCYTFRAAPGHTAPPQDSIPYRHVRLKDDRGRWIVDHTLNQDFMAGVVQGPIADRTKEKLGASDAGVILLRRMLLEQLEIVERGGEPMNVFREGDVDRVIELPMEQIKMGAEKPAPEWIPLEHGTSRDREKIEATLSTWRQST